MANESGYSNFSIIKNYLMYATVVYTWLTNTYCRVFKTEKRNCCL